jgi:hypothetical protein
MKLAKYCSFIVKLMLLILIGLTTININDGATQEEDALETTIKKQGNATQMLSISYEKSISLG